MINAVIIQSPCAGRSTGTKIPSLRLPWMEIVGRVSSISEGIKLVKSIKPNLVILDVDLPDGSGFKVFEETSNLNYEKIIICEHAGYAVKAARYQVADYLLKPLQNEEIIGAVERLLFSQKHYSIQRRFEDEVGKRGQLRLERLLIEGVNGREFIKVNDIMRITSEGGNSLLHLTSGKQHICSQRLGRLAYSLALNRFFRVGDTVFNLHYVQEYWEGCDYSTICMEDGYQIEIPLRLEQKLKSELNLPGTDDF